MTADLTALRPTEAARLLNSTPLGHVVEERRIREHMNHAGFRVAPDGRRVHLLRYAGWLCARRHTILAAAPGSPGSPGSPGAPGADGMDAYEQHRDEMARRSRDRSRSGRDIGDLPPVKNPRRRSRGRRSLRYFCEAYFEELFTWRWSQDHLDLLQVMQEVLIEGGQHAKAMWRGGGKSTIFEVASIWATFHGLRSYVLVLSKSAGKAEESAESIKTQIENNPRLAEDFPEVCYPISCLEGIYQRAAGQLHNGDRTYIQIRDRVMVLPTIAGAASSAATIRIAGLDGDFRGLSFTRPDLRRVRPDAVVIDDPQTDESAHSPTQCAKRERLIQGAVKGLGSHGRRNALVMTCTVIRRGDLADTYLDRGKYPQWRGSRAKLVRAFPSNDALWEEYRKLYLEEQAEHGTFGRATRHYRQHRAEMDAGADIAWRDAYVRGEELSAVQHAMNLRIEMGDHAFFAECQSEPLIEDSTPQDLVGVDEIQGRLNQLERGVVPMRATRLTMFVDVHADLLYWLVAAWEEDFTGYVVDYGTFPDQRALHFAKANAKHTMEVLFPGAGLEARLRASFETLIEQLAGREFKREDGTAVSVGRVLIDANWGEQTETVYEFARRSTRRAIITPSHGKWFGATSMRTLGEYTRKPGDRVGWHWRIPVDAGRRGVRRCVFDANAWKSMVFARLAVPIGDPGSLSLWGRDKDRHRLLAEHITAEVCEQVEARERVVGEWRLKRPGLDNHWLDCLVGAAVAASIEGCALPSVGGARPPARKRVSFAELQRRAGGARRSA